MPVEYVQQKIDAARAWLWSREAMQGNRLQRFAVTSARIVAAVMRDLGDGHLSLRAMSLVYTTVIAIVPVIALSFSVLKGFGMHHRVKPALLDAMVDLGDKRFDIVDKIMGFINNVNVGVLGSVGFAILIYSVISMMHKIEDAFNYTWQIKRARDLSQRFRDYLSVIFVGPLLIFLSAAITTSVNTSVAADYFRALPFGGQAMGVVGYVLPYLMMSVGFAFIYAYLPNTRVRIGSAFVGGLVTAVVWKIMGWGVATFIANSANQVAIYSAFASVIILMVWLYLGWLVLLVGASVSFYHQSPQYLRVRREHITLSAENSEKLALNMLYLIGKHYRDGKQPWTADTLAEYLAIAPYLVEEMCENLEAGGFLVRAAGNSAELYPRRPLDQVELSGALQFIRQANSFGREQKPFNFDEKIRLEFQQLDSAMAEHFSQRSLGDLLDENQQNKHST
ncbi:MAG: YihY/virulence factor BrkB family protein [Gammaproteobacteria bacterium]|nr:YihY/virulence factor BrkB family protein [Gammaproteobacteria bacterium]